MKILKIFLASLIVVLSIFSTAYAGDFDWTRDFNVMAAADPSGFRARLETRFRVGDAEIGAVISNAENFADAYMLLRFGEISHQPMNRVMERYRAEKGKGWGVLAKSLGIKPGSEDFKALKYSQDLYVGDKNSNNKSNGKAKSKSKDKGKR